MAQLRSYVVVRPFRPHIYTVQELGQILRALHRRSETSRHRVHWLGAEEIVFLLYACGMRMSEPLKLRLQDVDLQERVLFIACTKFYKQRWIPLGAAACRRLAAYLQERNRAWPERCAAGDPFFLNLRGRAYSRPAVGAVFRGVVDELGIRSRGTGLPRLHDLRHSCAVHRLYKWYADGADVQNRLPLLTTYLGHAKIVSTQAYLHLTEDLLRQAGRGFQAVFERVVPSPRDS